MSCRYEIADAIKELCCARAVKKDGLASMDWVYGIPLYSFLTDTFVPYDDVCSIQDVHLIQNWHLVKDKFRLVNVRTKIANNVSL